MPSKLADALQYLAGGSPGSCSFRVASDAIGGMEEADRLDRAYEEAVATLTRAHGTPLGSRIVFPGKEVERAVCWKVGGKIVFLRIDLEDNSRMRTLLLGACNPGELRGDPGDGNWWSKHPGVP